MSAARSAATVAAATAAVLVHSHLCAEPHHYCITVQSVRCGQEELRCKVTVGGRKNGTEMNSAETEINVAKSS